mmetsp:Transcript_43243/g.112275  ORF Transcript_43243/g.112275 Transcript_43243/m.112275 type:complete len:471 (+) Transcript_43243:1605-3017(+)
MGNVFCRDHPLCCSSHKAKRNSKENMSQLANKEAHFPPSRTHSLPAHSPPGPFTTRIFTHANVSSRSMDRIKLTDGNERELLVSLVQDYSNGIGENLGRVMHVEQQETRRPPRDRLENETAEPYSLVFSTASPKRTLGDDPQWNDEDDIRMSFSESLHDGGSVRTRRLVSSNSFHQVGRRSNSPLAEEDLTPPSSMRKSFPPNGFLASPSSLMLSPLTTDFDPLSSDGPNVDLAALFLARHDSCDSQRKRQKRNIPIHWFHREEPPREDTVLPKDEPEATSPQKRMFPSPQMEKGSKTEKKTARREPKHTEDVTQRPRDGASCSFRSPDSLSLRTEEAPPSIRPNPERQITSNERPGENEGTRLPLEEPLERMGVSTSDRSLPSSETEKLPPLPTYLFEREVRRIGLICAFMRWVTLASHNETPSEKKMEYGCYIGGEGSRNRVYLPPCLAIRSQDVMWVCIFVSCLLFF